MRRKLLAAGLSLTLAAAGCESAPSADAQETQRTTREAAVARRVLEGFVTPPEGEPALEPANMCRWSPQRPLTQPSGQRMRIDGRCAFPIPPDGNLEGGYAGVYEKPDQSSRALGRVEGGAYVTALCFTIGQEIEDGIHRKSQMWIKISMSENGTGQIGNIPSFASGYALPPNPC